MLEKVTFFLDKDDESVSCDIELSEMTLQKIFSCALVRKICDMGNARGILLGKWDVRCLHTYCIWSRKLLLQKRFSLAKKGCVLARADTPQLNRPCNIAIDSFVFLKKVP